MNLTSDQVRKDQRHADAVRGRPRRVMRLQPSFAALAQCDERFTIEVLDGRDDPRGGFVDIDRVIEVEAVRQRHLVQQEILGCALRFSRKRILSGGRSVHRSVDSADDLVEGGHVDDPRLFGQPGAKVPHELEIGGIGNVAALTGGHRVFNRVDACEAPSDVFSILAKGDP